MRSNELRRVGAIRHRSCVRLQVPQRSSRQALRLFCHRWPETRRFVPGRRVDFAAAGLGHGCSGPGAFSAEHCGDRGRTSQPATSQSRNLFNRPRIGVLESLMATDSHVLMPSGTSFAQTSSRQPIICARSRRPRALVQGDELLSGVRVFAETESSLLRHQRGARERYVAKLIGPAS